jgi:hypothetical protein
MAEIKLVFAAKVPHRPAVATIGESAPLLSQRECTARRSPKFCANDRKPIFGAGARPRPNEKCVAMSAL